MSTKALTMETEEPVLNEFQDCSWRWHRDAAIALLLTVLAFAVRLNHVDFNSLSEDESAKWAAVQEYRHGHFVGVNSEHPMMLKVLAWASLTAGERWNRLASLHSWPTMSPEGWLRFPNVLFGAATTAILFLFCRRLIGFVGSFAASFFWAVSPLAVALNRLAKEETPLTFFTLLACYLYCRAQQVDSDESARRWYDLSAIGFGLAFASQYILHLLGLNALAWFLAGRTGLNRKPSRFSYRRFFLVMLLTFILVNPVVLFPRNFTAIVHWLHHDGVTHSGYDFNGTLYLNFPSRLLAGVPWTYYLWLLLVKTPVPILVAVIARKHHAAAGPPDARVVFFPFSGSGSAGRAFDFWCKVGALFTGAAAISFSGWRFCRASNLGPHEGKENVAGICCAGRCHSGRLAFA